MIEILKQQALYLKITRLRTKNKWNKLDTSRETCSSLGSPIPGYCKFSTNDWKIFFCTIRNIIRDRWTNYRRVFSLLGLLWT